YFFIYNKSMSFLTISVSRHTLQPNSLSLVSADRLGSLPARALWGRSSLTSRMSGVPFVIAPLVLRQATVGRIGSTHALINQKKLARRRPERCGARRAGGTDAVAESV